MKINPIESVIHAHFSYATLDPAGHEKKSRAKEAKINQAVKQAKTYFRVRSMGNMLMPCPGVCGFGVMIACTV